MAVNVCFIMKHCFPTRKPPAGRGYAAVKNHQKQLKISMKDILFELASSYKVMNPIRGILPGSPLMVKGNTTSHEDEIDKQLETANSEWQKDATKYVRECITPDSRYKLKKFIDDEMLNKIRLDKTLFHIPKSKGSYIDSRTGRLTSSGNKAKEKTTGDGTPLDNGKKIRKCPPKCIVCCAMADPKDKEYKITQTTIYCSTCLVTLCIKKKGNRKSSCFEIFHQIGDLTSLKGKTDSTSPTPVNLSASRKRKAGSQIKK
jgi:hypothetical protein